MKIFITTLFLITSLSLWSQGQIGINTNNPDPSAVLDIQSDSLGILIPRMTSIQISNITNPANGLQVFNTTLQESFFFNANTGVWQQLSSIWKLNGDSIYYNNGNVGIGTISPKSNLHIVSNNPLFQMTNVNNYSIIIDLDDSDNDVFFNSNLNGFDKKLFTFTSDSKLGIGDIVPQASLHLFSDTPSFKITNGNTSSIIIDLDDSDNDIAFNGEIGNLKRKLFSVTQGGNFGIGIHRPDTTLHLTDESPFIQYTNINDISFYLGLKASDNNFVLQSPSLTFDFLNASATGGLSITGSNAVSISPGVLSSSLSLFNPLTSDTVIIEVDSTGGLTIPSTSLADRNNFLQLDIASDDSLYFGSNHTLSLTNSSLSNSPTNFSSLLVPSSGVTINSDGFYTLNYGLVFSQVASSLINPTVEVFLKVNGSVLESNYFGVWNERPDLKTLSKVYKFEENDVISIEMSVFSHNNTINHNVMFKKDGSYIELIKISN